MTNQKWKSSPWRQCKTSTPATNAKCNSFFWLKNGKNMHDENRKMHGLKCDSKTQYSPPTLTNSTIEFSWVGSVVCSVLNSQLAHDGCRRKFLDMLKIYHGELSWQCVYQCMWRCKPSDMQVSYNLKISSKWDMGFVSMVQKFCKNTNFNICGDPNPTTLHKFGIAKHTYGVLCPVKLHLDWSCQPGRVKT